MNYFNKNISIIKKERKYLYENIENQLLDKNKYTSDIVTSILAKNGEMVVTYNSEGTLYRLNSIYNPSEEARKWAEQFNFNNINIITVMFGLGNGIFVREILKNLGEEDILIIYEPSIDIFMHVLNNYDISDILENVRVSITVEEINPLEFTTVLNNYVTWTNLCSQVKCIHPQYDKLFGVSYNTFKNALKDIEIRERVNKNTEAFWGELMSENVFKNLKYIKGSNTLEDLKGLISNNVPAIIVSAGPSLDKNISELKKAKNRSVIFAVDTALKYLLQQNIIPDFVVTLDANKSMIHFTDERFSTIPLLCKYTSNPKVLDLHTGRKIFFYNDIFTGTIYESLGKEQLYNNVGGCVATAAFAICVGLNFKRIVLVGQDLCYQGDVTHAGQVIKNPYGIANDNKMIIKDIYGNNVGTRHDWYTYILWFQDAIKSLIDIEVIDATEGGAFIEGTKIIDLEYVIAQYCSTDFYIDSILNELEPVGNDNEITIVNQYLKSALKDLEVISQYSKECSEICDKLILAAKRESLNSYSSQEMINKISKYNNIMSEMPIEIIINDYISKTSTIYLDDINKLSEDVIDNQVRVYTKSKEIYKSMDKAANILTPLLELAIDNI